jgi:hypothetical protein
MATYREIKGLKVPYLDTDLPSASASTEEGGVWYNSATGKLRAFVAADTWSTTASINTARIGLHGAGTQTAAIMCGGATPPSTALTSVEEYNGSGWATTTSINTGRRWSAVAGTQAAAIVAGGYSGPPNVVYNESEEFDGSTWTEGDNLGTARYTDGTGIQTAALAVGGSVTPAAGGNTKAIVEQYDGSAWSEIADLNTTRRRAQAVGTTSSALMAGGGAGYKEEVEEWNGTSWTEIGDLGTAKYGIVGAGTTSSAFMTGGVSATVAALGTTELFDGSAWTETTDLSTARKSIGGAGTFTAAVAAGGEDINGTATTGTEEFAHQILTYTPAAWATGATLNVSRFGGNSLGTTSAALAVGGNTAITSAEEFDGTSWTAVNAMGTARFRAGSAGLQTSGLVVAGAAGPGGPITAAVEEYDGTNWTEQNDTPYARMQMGHAGTQTAAVCFGGGVPGPSGVSPEGSQSQTIEYDGTNWTVGGALPAARHAGGFGTAGTQTAALQAGGYPYLTTSLEYDGSSWSSGGTMIGAAEYFAISGTLTAMLAAGGATSAPNEASDLTQLYDGTSWYTDAATLNTGRKLLSGVGTTSSNLAVAGDPDGSTGVEEYTSTTSAAEAADIAFD